MYIRLNLIQLGQNQRRGRTPESFAALVKSVKKYKVCQSVMVVRNETGYTLITGHGRYLAAQEALGADYAIPAIVISEQEAISCQFGLVENILREAMCATDEAAAAGKMLGACLGDRKETALMLGWSASKLTKRLALLNAAEAVQIAFAKSEISLGHVELFAALAKSTQESLLPVIIKEKRSVPELRSAIERAACKLDNAIFDKTECNGCPHNSSLQTEMFQESLTAGSCTDGKCFQQKTEQKLEQAVLGLKDEFATIRIVRAGDGSTVTALRADGPSGVGADQPAACRQCQDFGAAVSGLPQETGKVFRNQCFNTVCHASKVAANVAANVAAQAISKASSVPANSSKTLSAPPSGASASTPPPAKPQSKAQATVAKPENERVKLYRIEVWKKTLQAEVVKNPALAARYLLALSLMGLAGKIDSTEMGKAFAKLTNAQNSVLDLGVCAEQVSALSEPHFQKLTTLQAVSAFGHLEERHVRQLLKFHTIDLSLHWALNEVFLTMITKTEIREIALEVGLDKRFGKAFNELFQKTKPQLILDLLAVKDFDYNRAIPKVMHL
jgi:PRTRC genetic system ParB family protein